MSPDTLIADDSSEIRADGLQESGSPPEMAGGPAPRRGRSPWEIAGRILFAILVIDSFPWVLTRMTNPRGSDFPEFHYSGQYLIERGVRAPRSEFYRYWPSLDVAATALGWLPLDAAAAVWYLVGCWSWIGLLRTIQRYLLPEASDTIARQATLAAGLLMMPLVLDHMFLGAFHILMTWCLVAGLARVARGRHWSGGLLLGLGVWIKLLPLAGVGYLVLKRKWLAAAVAIGSALTIHAVLCVVGYGPRAAWEHSCAWWRNEAEGTTQRLLTRSEYIDEDRLSNQSLAVVLRRLLTPMGGNEAGPARQRVALGTLSPVQLKTAFLAVTGALGLGILWTCRRPGRLLSPDRWATEINLVVLSTLWFSPVVWSYHPTAVTPVLALILSRRPTYPRLIWVVVGLWLLTMAMLGVPLARAAGAMLWMTFFLGAMLLWTAQDRPGAVAESATKPPQGTDRLPCPA